jgi:aspartyl-tRNA(Asn)/glutamyl-tRNA(Gln) amidotransferase subunit B
MTATENLTHEAVEGEHFTITSDTTGDEWEIVVGLEVHCELATATKLFCGCPNMFGDEPNTNVCPVCLGLPGSLPVLNHQVVELAMRLGRALHCTVEPSVFARKNYFYPDMPKDYQVSQYDRPINVDGWLDLPDGTRRPHIRHPEHAKTYIDELRAILLATGASDAKMEEGSLRVDANVSVRRVGDTALGNRCEVKNLNSLRSLGRAIEYEARRQVDLLESGESVKQETRHWDEGAGRTRPGRSKEEAEDYRYFQEPDLVPLVPSAEWVAAIDEAMPALPASRRTALAGAAGAAPTDTAVVVAVQRDLDALALAAIAAGADGPRVLTHVEHNLAVDGAAALDPAHLAALVRMEGDGSLTATQAKQVLADMVASGKAPDAIAAERGFEAMDSSELEGIVDGIIAENPDDWAAFCGGDEKKRGKLQGFFVGKVMKATKGQADGKAVNQILAQRAAG